ncbi:MULTISPECIES: hypothetical protein [Helcobacillus]|uniref:Uncharacterized protein n=1 Tax=Helcobacillus massiliensis TaxID=521392 RepID=A0A839QWT8_9MICO|nr:MULTISPECIES: hypothetical protein [Helcobacillus]MBB3023309.1 hypothetical protein [Helcobacillus massiliensis]MCG7426681.1 hypothetical protein [Helcobacillus sp. ACRRO]MDK7743076.1 hypothetical protein [Helcobacillus massiliensis]WOO92531.1 hypothetical protein R3I40_08920 [Helcobacillus massiliensis]
MSKGEDTHGHFAEKVDVLEQAPVDPMTSGVDLTAELAMRERIANTQRKILFWFVLGTIGLSLVSVVAFVALLGRGFLDVHHTVAAVFVSANSIQSFVLAAVLARGLFGDPDRRIVRK